MNSRSDDKTISVAMQYFRLSDQASREVLNLFHEDVEFYFPKFGFGVGRQAFVDFVRGFAGILEFIQHDYDKLSFIAVGDSVVVEGTSHGKMSGKAWVGGRTPGGRFCNVFRFRDDRISSIHVYLDPDYLGEDAARFRWGGERRW